MTQVNSLQVKIIAEDKAVEGRTGDYLSEWEKNKPVDGALRPDAALQKLALFESKYSRLKEERDNVAKAKEALELQVTKGIDRIFSKVVLFLNQVLSKTIDRIQQYTIAGK